MYSLIKVMHIGAFMLWLGPALGSWLVLTYMQRQQGETSTATYLVYRVFFATLVLEHVAFAGLLATGTWLAYSAGWFGSPWLWQKLLLIGAIVIPLEIVDVLLGNWKVKHWVERRANGLTLSATEQRLLQFYHGTFTKLALLLLPVTVLLIMVLAVSKQPVVG